MAINTLDDVFLEELKDIYNAEKQLTKALPKLAKAASDADLKEGFKMHLEETKGQVTRLEQCFELLGAPKRGKTCKAMEGLVEEGSEAIEEDAAPELKDAMLIAAAQKVEHYEIATYEYLIQLSDVLGHSDVTALLQETLDEEKATSEKLTACAADSVFPAGQGSMEEEEEEEAVEV